MKESRLQNRVFKIIAGSYVIVFLPLLLSYLALHHFTPFSGRMLLYALIPLAAVLLILFAVYMVRVAKTGRFWGALGDRNEFETLHNID